MNLTWAPVIILGFGSLLSAGIRPQLSVPLRTELQEAIPLRMASMVGTNREMSQAEREVVGMTDYVLRTYAPEGVQKGYNYSVFVSYYDQQERGRTIHSPKNCLPGGGWEALSATTTVVPTALGQITVNRYLLHYQGRQALVLYWYQGRNRIESNEYKVKFNLLRDAALRGRSEEALVRIVVPVTTTEQDAFKVASDVAGKLVVSVKHALPV